MWCPKGYATFREIQNALDRILTSDQAYEKFHDEVRWQTSAELDSEEYLLGSSAEARPLSFKERLDWIEAAQKWVRASCIREFFQNCPSLSVISPSGVCLRIDPRVMAFGFIPELGYQFTFVDAALGTISFAHAGKCYEISKATADEMRSRIDEIDRDKDQYNYYCTVCKVIDDYEDWKILNQFDNWAIGCELQNLPLDAGEFLSLDLRYSSSNPTGDVTDLTLAIVKAYDEGLIRSKEDLWKERFPNEKREAFRAAWAAASIDRPNLSKRGRKPLF